MVRKQMLFNEQQKKVIVEQIWLNYFNSYLFKNRMISEAQCNRMITKIYNRKDISYSKQR